MLTHFPKVIASVHFHNHEIVVNSCSEKSWDRPYLYPWRQVLGQNKAAEGLHIRGMKVSRHMVIAQIIVCNPTDCTTIRPWFLHSPERIIHLPWQSSALGTAKIPFIEIEFTFSSIQPESLQYSKLELMLSMSSCPKFHFGLTRSVIPSWYIYLTYYRSWEALNCQR